MEQKGEMIKSLDDKLLRLNARIKEHEEGVKNQMEDKTSKIKAKDKLIEELTEKLSKNDKYVKDLKKNLIEKKDELKKESKRNEMMRELLNEKEVDNKKLNENFKEQLEAKDGNIEDLEHQVWNELEEYKNLMFAKESVDEDNYQEIDKLDKEQFSSVQDSKQ